MIGEAASGNERRAGKDEWMARKQEGLDRFKEKNDSGGEEPVLKSSRVRRARERLSERKPHHCFSP